MKWGLKNKYTPEKNAKEQKTADMENPFSLYYSLKDDTVEDRQKNAVATKEFKKTWDEFITAWRALQKKHESIGASDTAARDAQVDWIKNKATDVW